MSKRQPGGRSWVSAATGPNTHRACPNWLKAEPHASDRQSRGRHNQASDRWHAVQPRPRQERTGHHAGFPRTTGGPAGVHRCRRCLQGWQDDRRHATGAADRRHNRAHHRGPPHQRGLGAAASPLPGHHTRGADDTPKLACYLSAPPPETALPPSSAGSAWVPKSGAWPRAASGTAPCGTPPPPYCSCPSLSPAPGRRAPPSVTCWPLPPSTSASCARLHDHPGGAVCSIPSPEPGHLGLRVQQHGVTARSQPPAAQATLAGSKA